MKRPRVVHARHEAFDVYVGRPSYWGNPFTIGPDGTRSEVIEQFKEYFYRNPAMMKKAKEELKGKTLGCHCAPMDCHASILLEYANKE